MIQKSFCEASHRHSHWHRHRHSHTPTQSHSNSHRHVFYYLVTWGASLPIIAYKYMINYIAVAVAVAVSGGVAVPVVVPVLWLCQWLCLCWPHKKFFNQKDFLVNVWGYCPTVVNVVYVIHL